MEKIMEKVSELKGGFTSEETLKITSILDDGVVAKNPVLHDNICSLVDDLLRRISTFSKAVEYCGGEGSLFQKEWEETSGNITLAVHLRPQKDKKAVTVRILRHPAEGADVPLRPTQAKELPESFDPLSCYSVKLMKEGNARINVIDSSPVLLRDKHLEEEVNTAVKEIIHRYESMADEENERNKKETQRMRIFIEEKGGITVWTLITPDDEEYLLTIKVFQKTL